jgi:hypothetical protein
VGEVWLTSFLTSENRIKKTTDNLLLAPDADFMCAVCVNATAQG